MAISPRHTSGGGHRPWRSSATNQCPTCGLMARGLAYLDFVQSRWVVRITCPMGHQHLMDKPALIIEAR